MPTGDDLCGLGMAPSLATELGNQPNTLTCTGTSQGTAATVKTKSVELNAQSSQTGAILPATAKIGSPYYFANGTISAASAVIYAPVGHYFNGTLNASTTIVQNGNSIAFQYKKGYWFTN
jgi:hypothetical protein